MFVFLLFLLYFIVSMQLKQYYDLNFKYSSLLHVL